MQQINRSDLANCACAHLCSSSSEYAPIILFFARTSSEHLFRHQRVSPASVLAIAYARFATRKVSTARLSLGIIVIFGGATRLLHDETFIKWKPSRCTAPSDSPCSSAAGTRARLDRVLFSGRRFRHLTPSGAASWAWIVFFAFMAALNGYVATQWPAYDAWVNFQGVVGDGHLFRCRRNVVVLAKCMEEAAR